MTDQKNCAARGREGLMERGHSSASKLLRPSCLQSGRSPTKSQRTAPRGAWEGKDSQERLESLGPTRKRTSQPHVTLNNLLSPATRYASRRNSSLLRAWAGKDKSRKSNRQCDRPTPLGSNPGTTRLAMRLTGTRKAVAAVAHWRRWFAAQCGAKFDHLKQARR